jgi:hypothetical protein
MDDELRFDTLPQPDNTACGPTCLHAVYRYYGVGMALQQVVDECLQLEEGECWCDQATSKRVSCT